MPSNTFPRRDSQFWKWHKFAQDSQSVLVYGIVPQPAVLASVPLLQILRKLPAYILRKDLGTTAGNPLTQLAWDYSSRKLSYRQFAHQMTKLFTSQPTDVRLRDTTGGAVRLALAFLGPFFHEAVQVDFNNAVDNLRHLATTISAWPSATWIQEHPEVPPIVDSMALALAEELRYKYRQREGQEILRLYGVIHGLEKAIQDQNSSLSTAAPPVEVDSDVDSDGEGEDLERTLVALDVPEVIKLTLPATPEAISPLPRLTIQTPITPPDSPRNSFFVAPARASAVEIVTTFLPLIINSPVLDATAAMTPDGASVRKSPASEELASPPPTPPARITVFSPPTSHVLESVLEPVQEVDCDQEQESESLQDSWITVVDPSAVEPILQSIPEEKDPGSVVEAEETYGGSDEDREGSIAGHSQAEEDDDDKTDCDSNEQQHDFPKAKFDSLEQVVPTRPNSPPLFAWVPSPPAYMRSPRHSISSVDTLIEANDFPLTKRILASHPEPFSFMRRFSSFSFEPRSRTISFSGLSAIAPENAQELIVEPANMPLPPSPSLSTVSSPTSSPVVSRAPSPQPRHMLVSEPAAQTFSKPYFLPPKEGISLLAPIEQDEEEADISAAAALVTDTASYLVTGFLVGAVITLFLFSTQRRALLYVT